MAFSKNLQKDFNATLPFADFFYILQQEEYSSGRYLHWLPRFFFRRNFQVRDHLKYTARVKSSLILAVLIWYISGTWAMWAASQWGVVAAVIVPVIWIVLIPVFVVATNWLLTPLYGMVKRRVLRRAAATVRARKDLKIVVVAGSFGKTTTKNFIYELVRSNWPAQMIPGNINTPLGIGAWVRASLAPGTRLLIAEADAYRVGEIAQSLSVIPPDIAIVTNIGDQHLERFGSKEQLARALKETFLSAKPGAHLLCNKETATAFGGVVEEGKKVEIVKTAVDAAHLSASARIDLAFAIRVAEILGVPESFIMDTCRTLELPERRQRMIEWHGYRCMDDSYNISLTTARAGIEAAKAVAHREGKKLLVITAGIPEADPAGPDANEALGKEIAAAADHAVILQSMFAGSIARGIGDTARYSFGRGLASLVRNEAAKIRGTFPPDEWVVLLEPELTDLYY